VLKILPSFLEFAIQPRNWLTIILFVGGVAVFLNDSTESIRLFWTGWFFASFIAYAPAIFSRSWDNRSQTTVRCDRSLAYCEGWRRCLASLQAFNELPESEVTDEFKRKAVDSDFESGLTYVKEGRHMHVY
jgi:hypothetical protein